MINHLKNVNYTSELSILTMLNISSCLNTPDLSSLDRCRSRPATAGVLGKFQAPAFGDANQVLHDLQPELAGGVGSDLDEVTTRSSGDGTLILVN